MSLLFVKSEVVILRNKKVYPVKGGVYKLSFTYNDKKIDVITNCLYSTHAEYHFSGGTSGGSIGVITLYGSLALNDTESKVTNFDFPKFDCIFEIRESKPYSLKFGVNNRLTIYPYEVDEDTRPNLHALAEYLGIDTSTLTSNYIKLQDNYPTFYFKIKEE